MYVLNKVNLSKLGIPYYGKKSNHSIVHSNDATYIKLHEPIVNYNYNYTYIHYKYTHI